jgi:hypothetical protein
MRNEMTLNEDQIMSGSVLKASVTLSKGCFRAPPRGAMDPQRDGENGRFSSFLMKEQQHGEAVWEE